MAKKRHVARHALPRHPWLRRLAKFAGLVLLLASLGFVAQRLWHLDWASIEPMASWALLGAFVLAALLFSLADHALAFSWAHLVDPRGEVDAGRLRLAYGRSVLLKYLPGSVFQYVGRHAEARELRLPHTLLGRSYGQEIAFHIVASLSVAAACLAAGTSPIGAVIAIIVTFGVCLTLRSALTAALALQLLAFAAFALAAIGTGWVLFDPQGLPWRFGALFLLAWLAGFLVPMAPGGLGVREAVLLVLASGTYPSALVLTAMLVMRAASIAGDVAYGLNAVWRGRFRNP